MSQGPAPYRFADTPTLRGQSYGARIFTQPAALVFPTYASMGVTVFRPFPPFDPTTGQWLPYRTSAESGYFTDWIRRYPAVTKWGRDGITILLKCSDYPDMDATSTPPAVLARAIRNAVRNREEQQGWAAMTTGSQGKSEQLSSPVDLVMVQGVLLQKDNAFAPGKVTGFRPEDQLQVLALKGTAGDAVVAQLNQLKAGVPSTVESQDWENIMEYGDICRPDAGKFILVWRAEDGDPRQRLVGQQAAWNYQQAMATPQGNQARGYSAALSPNWQILGDASMMQFEQVARTKVQPWNALLRFPTLRELIAVCREQFPPAMLLYAWQDHPDWDLNEIRLQVANAMAVPVGGYLPPGMGPGGAQGLPPNLMPPGPPAGYPGGPAPYQAPAAYPGNPAAGGYPPPQGGYPQQGGYSPPSQPAAQQPGAYPGSTGGYIGAPAPVYPPQQPQGGFPQQGGYPPPAEQPASPPTTPYPAAGYPGAAPGMAPGIYPGAPAASPPQAAPPAAAGYPGAAAGYPGTPVGAALPAYPPGAMAPSAALPPAGVAPPFGPPSVAMTPPLAQPMGQPMGQPTSNMAPGTAGPAYPAGLMPTPATAPPPVYGQPPQGPPMQGPPMQPGLPNQPQMAPGAPATMDMTELARLAVAGGYPPRPPGQ